MPAPTKPPFRAEHVGSLIRPEALIAARQAAEKAEIAPAELARIQRDAIADVVRLQEDIGLRLVTDGEYNRTFWQRDFLLKFAMCDRWRQSSPCGFTRRPEPATMRRRRWK